MFLKVLGLAKYFWKVPKEEIFTVLPSPRAWTRHDDFTTKKEEEQGEWKIQSIAPRYGILVRLTSTIESKTDFRIRCDWAFDNPCKPATLLAISVLVMSALDDFFSAFVDIQRKLAAAGWVFHCKDPMPEMVRDGRTTLRSGPVDKANSVMVLCHKRWWKPHQHTGQSCLDGSYNGKM